MRKRKVRVLSAVMSAAAAVSAVLSLPVFAVGENAVLKTDSNGFVIETDVQPEDKDSTVFINVMSSGGQIIINEDEDGEQKVRMERVTGGKTYVNVYDSEDSLISQNEYDEKEPFVYEYETEDGSSVNLKAAADEDYVVWKFDAVEDGVSEDLEFDRTEMYQEFSYLALPDADRDVYVSFINAEIAEDITEKTEDIQPETGIQDLMPDKEVQVLEAPVLDAPDVSVNDKEDIVVEEPADPAEQKGDINVEGQAQPEEQQDLEIGGEDSENESGDLSLKDPEDEDGELSIDGNDNDLNVSEEAVEPEVPDEPETEEDPEGAGEPGSGIEVPEIIVEPEVLEDPSAEPEIEQQVIEPGDENELLAEDPAPEQTEPDLSIPDSSEEQGDLQIQPDVPEDPSAEQEGADDEPLEIQPDENEEHFLESEPGIELLNSEDFSSARLIVVSDNPDAVIDPEHVIGNFGNIYILQYSTPEQAMNAYVYYSEHTGAEPDENTHSAQETGFRLTGLDPVTESPFTEASDEYVQADIALIDTGTLEGPNVVERISLIDENLSGGGHGDQMVSAIVSQNPNAKILSIRALDDNGDGMMSGVIAGMEYAINRGVKIINLSVSAENSQNSVLVQEIQKAQDQGIIVVGAAGNNGADASGYTPGNIDSAWIIGACDETGARIPDSNYGSTVDCYAVAGSTSEAAAKFSGYVSAYGISSVPDNSVIFPSDYVPENGEAEEAEEAGEAGEAGEEPPVEEPQPDVSLDQENGTNEDPSVSDEPASPEGKDAPEDLEVSDEPEVSPELEAEEEEPLLGEDKYGLKPGDQFTMRQEYTYWVEDTDFDVASFMPPNEVDSNEFWGGYYYGQLSYTIGVTDYITYSIIMEDGRTRYAVYPFRGVADRLDAQKLSEHADEKIPSYVTQRKEFTGKIPDKADVTLDAGEIYVKKDSNFNPDYLCFGYDLRNFSVNVEDYGGFDITRTGDYSLLYHVVSYRDGEAFWYIKLVIHVQDQVPELTGNTKMILEWPGIFASVHFEDGTVEQAYYGKDFATDKVISYVLFTDLDDRFLNRFDPGVQIINADGNYINTEILEDEESFYKIDLSGISCSLIRILNNKTDDYNNKGGGFEQAEKAKEEFKEAENGIMPIAGAGTYKFTFSGLTYGEVDDDLTYSDGHYLITDPTGLASAIDAQLALNGETVTTNPDDIPTKIYISCCDHGAAPYDFSGWGRITLTITVNISPSGDTMESLYINVYVESNSAVLTGDPVPDPSNDNWQLGYQRFAGGDGVIHPEPQFAYLKLSKAIEGNLDWLENMAPEIFNDNATFVVLDQAGTSIESSIELNFGTLSGGRRAEGQCKLLPGTYYVREMYVPKYCVAHQNETVGSSRGQTLGPFTLDPHIHTESSPFVVPGDVESHAGNIINTPYKIVLNIEKQDVNGNPITSGPAYFMVEYYTEQNDPHTSSATPQWKGIFYTENGELTSDYAHYVDSYITRDGTSYTSDEFYRYEAGDNTLYFPPGFIKYYEIEAPEGYIRDETPVTIINKYKSYKKYVHDVHTDSIKQLPISPSTNLGVPKLKIIKTSTLASEILDEFEAYSLAGAEFGVYKDAGCTDKIGTLTTDEDGNTGELQLPCDTPGIYTYYVREDVAPPGHKLNTTVKPVLVNIPDDADKTLTVDMENEPEFMTLDAFVEKLSQKGKPVADVVFEVKLYEGEYSTAGACPASKLKKTWYLKSDSNGKVLFDDAYLADSMGYTSDSFYEHNGQIVIPLGSTVTFQEVEAPAEYVVNDEINIWQTNGNVIEMVHKYYNTLHPCKIKIKKYDYDGHTPLDGVTFELKFLHQSEDYTSEADPSFHPLLKEGESIQATTDSSGEILWENLDHGEYEITEVKTKSGRNLLKEPIKVTLPFTLDHQAAPGETPATDAGFFDENYSGLYYYYELLYEIIDQAEFKIPATGSNGTWWYGFIGFGILSVTALVLLLKDHRKK